MQSQIALQRKKHAPASQRVKQKSVAPQQPCVLTQLFRRDLWLIPHLILMPCHALLPINEKSPSLYKSPCVRLLTSCRFPAKRRMLTRFLRVSEHSIKKRTEQLRSIRFQSVFYFVIFAISSAKLSTRFSMPSPFSKRVKRTILTEPPSSFATASTCCCTVCLSSLTNAWSSRQFSE